MIDQDARERVYLTLCGLADGSGLLVKFSREEALDYAGVRDVDFEAAVDELVAAHRLRVEKNSSRRRFQALDLSVRRRAISFINAHRHRVAALASERARLNDRRLDGSTGLSPLPPLSIVRIEEAPPGKTSRYFFTVIVGGIGTFKQCVFVAGERPFVAGPSLRAGEGWDELVDFSPRVKEALVEQLQRVIAAGLHQRSASSA